MLKSLGVSILADQPHHDLSGVQNFIFLSLKNDCNPELRNILENVREKKITNFLKKQTISSLLPEKMHRELKGIQWILLCVEVYTSTPFPHSPILQKRNKRRKW